MNFIELLMEVGQEKSIEAGVNVCLKHGKKEAEHYRKGMAHVWDELMNTNVGLPHSMKIRVYETSYEDEGKQIFYLDVDGYDPTTEEEYWAMDFVPWSQWLSAEVMQESLDKYGLEVCVGEILWEMTFYGWTYADTKKKGDEILER